MRGHLNTTTILYNDVTSFPPPIIFPCSVCIAMPQLTPEFERVIIYAISTTDLTHFVYSNCIKLTLMLQEVRMSEDYCHSDILILDLANYTLGHVPKISLTDVKKYELCVLVSVLVIRNVC